ncbi:Trk1p [Lachancea thermotolerans CBS 6340]|uniref:Potassium transport protein n=1 Tax=Lachancea thermotolerans (strain ATCC 56472 / CBS 6340 / NRRL Y-8284) TaxID=559295 RepID=C5DKM4_LACTC|nr:KLTH0F05896p [Lachancea thermotolerans CBS 6340]CAR24025.1 KLTH0F05896p [Lachancea thermotolerans CBS 6340]
MQAWKTLSRRPTLASINITYHKTIGHRLRDIIEYVGNVTHPFVKHIFPNFIAVHYFYIITLSIIGSILIYPIKNFAYIDILFMATGAATQGGLNTINVNDMTLYQQIVLYLICCLATPIWIHGVLAFVRLYWFERYFDGIRDWSKKNFKVRRTKTLIQREMTRTATEAQRRHKTAGRANNDFQSKLFSGQMIKREEQGGVKENYEMNSLKDAPTGGSEHKDPHTSSSTGTTKSDQEDSPAIKFGDMPKPHKSPKKPADIEMFSGRRRSEDITPADMFRSIAMLQNRHNEEEEEHDGPALVIRGPAERRQGSDPSWASVPHSGNIEETKDKDSRKPATHSINSPSSAARSPSFHKEADYSPTQWSSQNESRPRTPSSIQFNIGMVPSSKPGNPQYHSSNRKKLNTRIMKKLTPRNRLRKRLRKTASNTDEDGNDADFEQDSLTSGTDHDQDEESLASFGLSSQHSSQAPNMEKVQSTLAVPSGDATGGSKFYKRSLTMEAPGNSDWDVLTKSPSFQKMIYNKWKDERRRKKGVIHSAYRRPSLAHSTSELDSGFNLGHDARTMTDEALFGNNHDEEYFGTTFEEPTDRPRLKRMSTNYLSWQPKIGRNSTFVGMNEIQRAELGGVEYRAIKLLCKLLLLYYIGFHVMGMVMLLPWITQMKHYAKLVREDGVAPAWWGFFTAMSSFNDLGLTLTPDSMVSFNKAIYPLIVMMWFIIIGNTGFPVFLRFIIWVMFKLSPELSLIKESLGFLLDHPRRCFTLLFPSAPTWWLLFILVTLNAIDLILFIVLDLNSQVVEGLTSGFKVLNGLFQAVSTRTAGFTILNLSKLHPSIQVSYMLMMYVSVLPLAISIRRTNVYEEQSLGIYDNGGDDAHHKDSSSDSQSEDERNLEKSAKSFIGAHLRRQLSFDLWFLFLGLFIICISEGGKIQDTNKPDFTVFQVLFEIVSAYGTVGLSLGYPNTDQSFSGQFNTFSKVIIIGMLIRGRHRGLPYSLDRAIILPSQSLERRDQLQDLKQEQHTTEAKDPIVDYLRRQSRSAKGQLRSLLSRRKRPTSDESVPLRSFSNHENLRQPSASNVSNLSPAPRSSPRSQSLSQGDAETYGGEESSSISSDFQDMAASGSSIGPRNEEVPHFSDEPPTALEGPRAFEPNT